MPIDAGCYNIATRCDGPECHARGSFNGRNEREALREARERRWLLNVRTGAALCPACRPDRRASSAGDARRRG